MRARRGSFRLMLCAALLAHAVVLALLLRAKLDQLPVAGDVPAIQWVMAAAPPALAAAAQVLPVSSAVLPARPARAPMVVLVPRAPLPIALRSRAMGARTTAGTPAVAGPTPQPMLAAQAVPAPLPGPDPAVLAGLNAAIDQAVRAAAVMPAAARRQHREGRAQVGFVYVDGAVSGVALLRSSQSMVLDAAALHAVQGAKYPLPPAPLRGRKLSLSLWVNFLMAAAG